MSLIENLPDLPRIESNLILKSDLKEQDLEKTDMVSAPREAILPERLLITDQVQQPNPQYNSHVRDGVDDNTIAERSETYMTNQDIQQKVQEDSLLFPSSNTPFS